VVLVEQLCTRHLNKQFRTKCVSTAKLFFAEPRIFDGSITILSGDPATTASVLNQTSPEANKTFKELGQLVSLTYWNVLR